MSSPPKTPKLRRGASAKNLRKQKAEAASVLKQAGIEAKHTGRRPSIVALSPSTSSRNKGNGKANAGAEKRRGGSGGKRGSVRRSGSSDFARAVPAGTVPEEGVPPPENDDGLRTPHTKPPAAAAAGALLHELFIQPTRAEPLPPAMPDTHARRCLADYERALQRQRQQQASAAEQSSAGTGWCKGMGTSSVKTLRAHLKQHAQQLEEKAMEMGLRTPLAARTPAGTDASSEGACVDAGHTPRTLDFGHRDDTADASGSQGCGSGDAGADETGSLLTKGQLQQLMADASAGVATAADPPQPVAPSSSSSSSSSSFRSSSSPSPQQAAARGRNATKGRPRGGGGGRCFCCSRPTGPFLDEAASPSRRRRALSSHGSGSGSGAPKLPLQLVSPGPERQGAAAAEAGPGNVQPTPVAAVAVPGSTGKAQQPDDAMSTKHQAGTQHKVAAGDMAAAGQPSSTASSSSSTSTSSTAGRWHWDSSMLAERAARTVLTEEGGMDWDQLQAIAQRQPEAVDLPQWKGPRDKWGPLTEPAMNSGALYDPYGDNFMAAHQRSWPNHRLLMTATKSSNANIVCYRAVVTGDYRLATKEPIEQFWFDIEPSYVKKHRKKKTRDDAVKMNFLEKSGFGLTVSIDNSGEQSSLGCTMNGMPKHLKQEFRLVWCGPRDPRLVGLVKGRSCYMEKLHFSCRPRKPNPVPHIDKVTIFGTAVDDGAKLTDIAHP
jgi:hypothetical protein